MTNETALREGSSLMAALEPILSAIAASGKVEEIDRHNIRHALTIRAALSTPPIAGQEVRNIAADKVRELRGGVAISDRDFDIADAILALSAPPAVTSQSVGQLGYSQMGSGGRCDFQQLREAVAEATCGDRTVRRTVRDDVAYPGHDIVPQINFNSLDRIVTAFVDAALAEPASPPPVGEPDYCEKCDDSGYVRENGRQVYCDCICGHDAMDQAEGKGLHAKAPPAGEQGEDDRCTHEFGGRRCYRRRGHLGSCSTSLSKPAASQSQDEGLREALAKIAAFQPKDDFSGSRNHYAKGWNAACAWASGIARAVLSTPATTTEGGRG